MISDLSKLNRVNVVGTSGSGKTTFSRRLAALLNAPCLEMDALFWRKNWQSCTEEELFSILSKAVSEERWILDGNYSRTTSLKWERVQTVIWLDYPFITNFFRLLKRSFSRMIDQKELWEGTGNRESFRLTFLSKRSILLWMLKTYRKNKKKYDTIYKQAPGITFIRLRTPREAEKFLKDLEWKLKQKREK